MANIELRINLQTSQRAPAVALSVLMLKVELASPLASKTAPSKTCRLKYSIHAFFTTITYRSSRSRQNEKAIDG